MFLRLVGAWIWLRRLAFVAGAGVVAVALWTPAPAAAHAVLISSTPAAGSTLGATPGEVVLNFDEPLVESLSRATVVDPTGVAYAGVVSGQTIRVALTTNAPGAYRVSWATVSEVDGHTITGAFEFGVGVPVAAGAAAAALTGWDVLIAGLRTVEYAALLLACGLAVLRLLGRREVTLRMPLLPVAAVLAGSGATVICVEAMLATGGSLSGFVDYLSVGATGWARVARICLEATVLLVVVLWNRLSTILLAATIGALAVASHAANADPVWLGIVINALHLAAAGVWAGGIMALALVRLVGAWPSAGKPLLPRFSRIAPWAFLASVGLGAVQAAQMLGGPRDILGSGYGLTLVLKGAAVAAMVPLSWLAWRRLRPMVRTEAGVALVVVAAAAALAAYPVVPRVAQEQQEEAAAAAAAAAASDVSPFPQAGDLTIADHAGETLVGLTVRPARPGHNQVLTYLNPAPPPEAAVRLEVGGTTFPLSTCGPMCRSAAVDLRGGEDITIAVPGEPGGSAVFQLPVLPAADGGALVESATAWMDRLDTYQVDEDLSGIHSAYAFARPDKMWLRVWYGAGPRDTVWLGRSIYKRNAPDAAWDPPSPAMPPPVPYFSWNPFKPLVEPVVMGIDEVDDTPVTLVSAFGGHGEDPAPVWFTLAIDDAGRVLRSQMWAPYHFMDDRYFGFNEPVTIPQPDSG